MADVTPSAEVCYRFRVLLLHFAHAERSLGMGKLNIFSESIGPNTVDGFCSFSVVEYFILRIMYYLFQFAIQHTGRDKKNQFSGIIFNDGHCIGMLNS